MRRPRQNDGAPLQVVVQQRAVQRFPESDCDPAIGFHGGRAPVGRYRGRTLLLGEEHAVQGIPPRASG